MVLPGVRTDPRTPGGMPDSGGTGPGPMPSMPKMGPGPGPTAAGVPDPSKIEELFTQYTSGQITRQDLISQLHTFSEGQGGILGLLEGMQEQPDQGMQGGMNGAMPGMQPGQPPQPGALPGSPQGPGVGGDPMIAPGAAKTPIPPLSEPLDARHQRISLMLQGFGLGPADADQMSTLLNPLEQTATGKRRWSEDEQLWVTDDGSQIAYDEAQAQSAEISGVGEGGTQADLFRVQAGLGSTTGSTAGGYVGGQYYGDQALFDPSSFEAQRAQIASRNMPGLHGREVAYDQAAVDAKMAEMQRQIDANKAQEADMSAIVPERTMEDQGLFTDASGQVWFNNRKVSKTQPGLEDQGRGSGGGYYKPMAGEGEPEKFPARHPLPGDERTNAAGEIEVLGADGKTWTVKAAAPKAAAPQDGTGINPNNPFGGSFHPFFGGLKYDAKDYEGQQGLFGTLGASAAGGLGRTATMLSQPYQDPISKEWFPNEDAFEEYRSWQKDPDNRIYGSPAVEPEFSHFEDIHGKRVDPSKYSAKDRRTKLVGIPKNVTRVIVKHEDTKLGGMTETAYNLNTAGMTEQAKQFMAQAMRDEKIIPYDADGNPFKPDEDGNLPLEAYQPGYHPIYGRRDLIDPTGALGRSAAAREAKAAQDAKLMAELQATLDKQKKDAQAKSDAANKVTKTYQQGDELPEGYYFETVDTDFGTQTTLKDKTGKSVGVDFGEGVELTTLADAGDELGVGTLRPGDPGYVDPLDAFNQLAEPWITQAGLDIKGGKYPMFQKFVANIQEGALSDDSFMTNIVDVIGELEMMTEKGDQAQAKRMSDTTANALVAKAAVKKEELDRQLQAGAAIGEIAGTATLAKSMEDAANAFKAAAAAGVVPQWQEGQMIMSEPDRWGRRTRTTAPGKWVIPERTAGGELPPGAESVEARGLTISEVDKERQRELDFSTVFGQYVNLSKLEGQAGKTPDETMETLEKQKFGLTKALANAEQTGMFDISYDVQGPADLIATTSANDQQWLNEYYTQGNPNDLHPSWFRSNLSPSGIAVADKIEQGAAQPGGLTGQQTLAAKRLAFEIDMGNRAADNADRLASIAEENNLNQATIAQNRVDMEGFIAQGQLSEAVEARKDATWLANEGLRIQREKMKLDTLQSLQDPATYLFAVRYGLLEQIGSVLGIDWGDDIITNDQLPTMVTPGTFPSRQEFEKATQIDQRIMLAEYASSQGFTIEQAGLTILGGTPGGRQIRRPSVLGVGR